MVLKWILFTKDKEIKMLLELLSIEGLFSSQYSWLVLVIIFVVACLLKVVTDMRTDLTLVQKSEKHHVNSNFLTLYTSKNNKQLLTRIRDSIERANKKCGFQSPVHQQLVAELDAEIDTIAGSFGEPQPEEDIMQ